ncbi:nitrilase family protein [Aquimarina aquimarini]|uniref:nitrilase family protein n=1 Tax=Aquimarina aquimarini TaxID=1191734 RepID=UPI000D55762F|nr:nitrilase family protein [Aquimarina aquimarini]
MKNTLQVTLIQSHLAWENPIQNRAVFSHKINSISQKTDLIVLPEMFTTGFTMNPETVAETMTGETMQWLIKMAKISNCAITGSIVIKEDDMFYNRMIFMYPDGTYESYNKHQLFTLAKEQHVYTAGQKEVIVEYLGWKIKLLICYDLRFPVWARNTTNYDTLIYVASWPKIRINAWDTLLKARAIENMCYCIGVNRVGLDGKGFEHNGHSAIYNVLGESILQENPIEKEAILYATLKADHIKQTRKKLPFLQDRDHFTFL